VDFEVKSAESADGGPLAAHRERLQRIVIATLGGCGLILVAAAGAQVARAAASTRPSHPVANLTQLPPVAEAASPPAPAADPAAAPSPAPPADPPTIGTLRLHWPAVPGQVWLDGEKVTTSSAVTACGTHELRVGAKGHPRSIRIPCGGELRVSR
jgi:hypothetical protein